MVHEGTKTMADGWNHKAFSGSNPVDRSHVNTDHLRRCAAVAKRVGMSDRLKQAIAALSPRPMKIFSASPN